MISSSIWSAIVLGIYVVVFAVVLMLMRGGKKRAITTARKVVGQVGETTMRMGVYVASSEAVKKLGETTGRMKALVASNEVMRAVGECCCKVSGFGLGGQRGDKETVCRCNA